MQIFTLNENSGFHLLFQLECNLGLGAELGDVEAGC